MKHIIKTSFQQVTSLPLTLTTKSFSRLEVRSHKTTIQLNMSRGPYQMCHISTRIHTHTQGMAQIKGRWHHLYVALQILSVYGCSERELLVAKSEGTPPSQRCRSYYLYLQYIHWALNQARRQMARISVSRAQLTKAINGFLLLMSMMM